MPAQEDRDQANEGEAAEQAGQVDHERGVARCNELDGTDDAEAEQGGEAIDGAVLQVPGHLAVVDDVAGVPDEHERIVEDLVAGELGEEAEGQDERAGDHDEPEERPGS